MSLFQTFELNYGQAETELAQLREFLNNNAIFTESEIVKKLKFIIEFWPVLARLCQPIVSIFDQVSISSFV